MVNEPHDGDAGMTLATILASGSGVEGYAERLKAAEVTPQWLAREWGTGGRSDEGRRDE